MKRPGGVLIVALDDLGERVVRLVGGAVCIDLTDLVHVFAGVGPVCGVSTIGEGVREAGDRAVAEAAPRAEARAVLVHGGLG